MAMTWWRRGFGGGIVVLWEDEVMRGAAAETGGWERRLGDGDRGTDSPALSRTQHAPTTPPVHVLACEMDSSKWTRHRDSKAMKVNIQL